MKTTLVLDDALFDEAKRLAHKSNRSISAIISERANLGRSIEKQRRPEKHSLQTVDLGAPLMSFDSRDAVMEALNDDGS